MKSILIQMGGLAAIASTFLSCSSTGYTSNLNLEAGTDQKVVLIHSVNASRNEQVAVQAEFVEAIALYSQLLQPGAENPEKLYKRFQEQVDKCAADLTGVSDRIGLMEGQAALLFENWSAELDEFASPNLRGKSETLLLDAESRFDQMNAEVTISQAKMDELLISFRDYVIFFNHNLNPRALATLREESTGFLERVGVLNKQLAQSRTRADEFVQSLDGRPAPAKKVAEVVPEPEQ